MTVLIIWFIAFFLIAYFANKRWDSGVSQGLDKMLPGVLKSHGENRYLWVAALSVLGATTLVRPVDILLVVILLAIIGLVVMKLVKSASGKPTH
jgi:preprotein translocase subunit SecG